MLNLSNPHLLSNLAWQSNTKLPGVPGLLWSRNGCHGILGMGISHWWLFGRRLPSPCLREVAPQWGYAILRQPLGCHRLKSLNVRLCIRHSRAPPVSLAPALLPPLAHLLPTLSLCFPLPQNAFPPTHPSTTQQSRWLRVTEHQHLSRTSPVLGGPELTLALSQQWGPANMLSSIVATPRPPQAMTLTGRKPFVHHKNNHLD